MMTNDTRQPTTTTAAADGGEMQDLLDREEALLRGRQLVESGLAEVRSEIAGRLVADGMDEVLAKVVASANEVDDLGNVCSEEVSYGPHVVRVAREPAAARSAPEQGWTAGCSTCGWAAPADASATETEVRALLHDHLTRTGVPADTSEGSEISELRGEVAELHATVCELHATVCRLLGMVEQRLGEVA